MDEQYRTHAAVRFVGQLIWSSSEQSSAFLLSDIDMSTSRTHSFFCFSRARAGGSICCGILLSVCAIARSLKRCRSPSRGDSIISHLPLSFVRRRPQSTPYSISRSQNNKKQGNSNHIYAMEQTGSGWWWTKRKRGWRRSQCFQLWNFWSFAYIYIERACLARSLASRGLTLGCSVRLVRQIGAKVRQIITRNHTRGSEQCEHRDNKVYIELR
jgi:hypothetical protein